jgi:predicted HicB family RNase H-like nuclease
MSQAAKYTYRVFWSEQDGEYVALCAEMPSLSWLAKSDEEAFRGIKKVVRGVLADMAKSGEPIPEPLGVRQYSGAFKVRIPPPLHRQLAIEAAETGVSLNRVVSMKLAR